MVYTPPTFEVDRSLTVLEAWGSFQIVVDGRAITYFRDSITEVLGWQRNEPFSHGSLTLRFPQIHLLDELGADPSAGTDEDMDLTWLREFVDVEVYRVLPDGTVDYAAPLFEGMLVAFSDSPMGLEVSCIGALYQLDLYVRMPTPVPDGRPIAVAINQQFNRRTSRPGLRTNPPPETMDAQMAQFLPAVDKFLRIEGDPFKYGTKKNGSGDQVLSGYVAELLIQMQETVPTVANLAVDGVFASGTTSWPAGGPDPATTSVVTDANVPGGAYLQLEATVPYGDGFRYQRTAATVGVPYRASARMRVLAGEFIAPALEARGLHLLVTEGAGGAMVVDTFYALDGTETTDMWLEVETTVTVPPDVVDPYVELRLYGVTDLVQWADVWLHTADPGDVGERTWGLYCDAGRVPALRPKDITTVNWTVHAVAPGVDVSLRRDFSEATNVVYGEGKDRRGSTWRNTFIDGSGQIGRFEPIAFGRINHSRLGDPSRGQYANPHYVPTSIRVEAFEAYGQGFSIEDGRASARQRIARASDPGWYGTVTLTTDPEEGHRFEVFENHNLLLRGYRGLDPGLLVHVAGVDVDVENAQVMLTVDSKARDLLTIQQLMERRRQQPTSESQVVIDYGAWDERAGSGFLPLYSMHTGAQSPTAAPTGFVYCPANTWTVGRFFAAEAATVTETVIKMLSADGSPEATTFVFAILSKHPYAVPWNPGEAVPSDPPPGFPAAGLAMSVEDVLPGEVIGWGGAGQLAGYSNDDGSGRQDAGGAVTGQLVDRASWSFQNEAGVTSLWFAVFPAANCYLQGRLRANT